MFAANVLHMIWHRWTCALCDRRHHSHTFANRYDDSGDLYCVWSCYADDETPDQK